MDGFARPPAYPIQAQELFSDLRLQLEAEHGRGLGYRELGEFVGKSKSTAHYWFEVYDHPQVLGLMTLLERLSPARRHAFVDSLCRALPGIDCLRLGRAELSELFRKQAGMTIITGGNGGARTLAITSLGHHWRRLNWKDASPAGLDLHPPSKFVPVSGVKYLDPALGRAKLQLVIRPLLARLLTARARLVLLNNVWSLLPEAHDGLLRSSAHKHIVVAGANLQLQAKTGLHVITLAGSAGRATLRAS